MRIAYLCARQILTGEPVTAPTNVLHANFEPRPQSAAPEIPPDLKALDAARENVTDKELPKSISDEIAAIEMPEQTRAQITEMYGQAHATQPAFDASVREIAQEIGTPHEPMIPKGLKGVGRAVEKTLADYGGTATQLKDLVRATIVVDDLHQAQAAVDAAAQKYRAITKYRDTLHSPMETSDGYRDINLNVMIDGHIAELQVNLPEILKAKAEMHALYEERRVLDSKAEHTAEEDARVAELDAQMKLRYQAAWAAVTNRLKAASSISEPSSRAQARDTGRPLGTSKASVREPPSGLGKQATGTPPTFQKTGSLPITGADIEKPPTAGILPKSAGPGESILKAAREAVMANPDLNVSIGETAPNGSGAKISAEELLARGDAQIAQAMRDADSAVSHCVTQERAVGAPALPSPSAPRERRSDSCHVGRMGHEHSRIVMGAPAI